MTLRVMTIYPGDDVLPEEEGRWVPFSSYIDQQKEIERLLALNGALCDKSNGYLVENARLAEENEHLRAELAVAKRLLTIAGLIEFREDHSKLLAELTTARQQERERCAMVVRRYTLADDPIESAVAAILKLEDE